MEEGIKKKSKLPHRIRRVLVWFAGFVVLLAVIAQLALWFTVGWLNAPDGQKWLQAQIDSALKGTGYSIAFDQLRYRLISNVALAHLELRDDQGVLAQAQDITLGISLSTLAAKRLGVSLNISALDIIRFPKDKEAKKPRQPGEPLLPAFTIPDIYFTRLALSDINIKKLSLPPVEGAKQIILSPNLSGSILLSNGKIKADLTLENKGADGENTNDLPLPATLSARIDLDSSIPLIKIEKLHLERAQAYTLNGQGTLNLGPVRALDIKLPFEFMDLEKLAPGHPGTAKGEITISGTVENPAVDLNTNLTLAEATQNNIAAIEVALAVTNLLNEPQGKAAIKTRYKDMPLTLETLFAQQKEELDLKDIVLTAPDVSGSGNIKINLTQAKAKGTLKVGIRSLAPYAGFHPEMESLKLNGGATATLDLKVEQTLQTAAVQVQLNKTNYNDVEIETLNLSAYLPDVFMTPIPWPQEIKADVTNLKTGALALEMGAATLTDVKEGRYKIALNANGTARQEFSLNAAAEILGLKEAQPEAQNIKAAIKTSGGEIKLSGRIGQKDLDMALTSANFPLSGLPLEMPPALAALTLSINAAMTGPMDKPEASADITLSPIKLVHMDHAPDILLSATADYKPGKLSIKGTGKGKGIKTLSADLSLPVALSLQPFKLDAPGTMPLTGAFGANLNGSDLAMFMLPPTQTFNGQMQAQGTIGGVLESPEIAGNLTLDEAVFKDKPSGLTLAGIAMRATLTANALTLDSLTGTDGEDGTLQANGTYNFGTASAADFALTMDRLHLLRGKTADGKLSADLKLGGAGRDYTLKGSITPEYININIPQSLGVTIPQLNIEKKKQDTAKSKDLPYTVALDVQCTAKNRIFVRGQGLDAEFGGTVEIAGTLQEPLLEGTMKSLRGTYSEFGKRFELTRAELRFSGTIPPGPYLDVLAETKADEINAQIAIKGPVSKPAISLSSVPPLPEDEVLARILFGKDMQNISPYQAIQLAQTLRRLAGGGGPGFDPMGSVLDATGLDDLSVDVSEEGSATVGAGKYLSEKVYLEVKGGSGQDSGAARIEIEVTPDISVESEIGQDAQGGAGIFWKRDY